MRTKLNLVHSMKKKKKKKKKWNSSVVSLVVRLCCSEVVLSLAAYHPKFNQEALFPFGVFVFPLFRLGLFLSACKMSSKKLGMEDREIWLARFVLRFFFLFPSLFF